MSEEVPYSAAPTELIETHTYLLKESRVIGARPILGATYGRSKSVSVLAITSCTKLRGTLQMGCHFCSFQSWERMWSQRTTPAMVSPVGTSCSKGLPLALLVMGQKTARPVLAL